MKVPNFEKAFVHEEKVYKYLLNSGHPDGFQKAKFFKRFGFSLNNWNLLVNSLILHCRENDVIKTQNNLFGTKYIVSGPMITPDNRNPELISICFVAHNENIPKFVTAYPSKQ